MTTDHRHKGYKSIGQKVSPPSMYCGPTHLCFNYSIPLILYYSPLGQQENGTSTRVANGFGVPDKQADPLQNQKSHFFQTHLKY